MTWRGPRAAVALTLEGTVLAHLQVTSTSLLSPWETRPHAYMYGVTGHDLATSTDLTRDPTAYADGVAQEVPASEDETWQGLILNRSSTPPPFRLQPLRESLHYPVQTAAVPYQRLNLQTALTSVAQDFSRAWLLMCGLQGVRHRATRNLMYLEGADDDVFVDPWDCWVHLPFEGGGGTIPDWSAP